jgi:hypothetical protein
MTNHISTLQNLKAMGMISALAFGVNLASCQFSRLFWFVTREALTLASNAAMSAWRASEVHLLGLHLQLLGCPVEALALLRPVFHAIFGAL